MTIKEAREICRSLGFTLIHDGDEFVLFKTGTISSSPSAYNTPDLDDAVLTARNWNRKART